MNSDDRKMHFENVLKDIIAHNSNPDNTWIKGINEYSDLSDEEFIKYFNIVNAP